MGSREKLNLVALYNWATRWGDNKHALYAYKRSNERAAPIQMGKLGDAYILERRGSVVQSKFVIFEYFCVPNCLALALQ